MRVFRGAAAGTAFRIAARGTTIGRSGEPSEADIPIDDALTARRQATLTFDRTAWSITDLGSLNGGFVDGAVLARDHQLRIDHGTVIRLGDTVGVFVTDHLDHEDTADPGFFPGVSAAARRVRRRVEVLARATGHVLILGETGTGKERVARRLGASASKFIPVNCAELSRELARSELFGHARNSFSGATAHDGLIERAADGVLFLDEVGELPVDVQSELLRFLDDGSYRPVGSSELRQSRARVVAATNVDVDDASRTGSFRRDLLARLRASNPPLVLPPLRERREDIPGWIDMFVREAVDDVPARYCEAGALECLLLFTWPENLRELRGTLRGALEEPRVWPLSSSRLPARIQDHRVALRGFDVGGQEGRPRATERPRGGAPLPAAAPGPAAATAHPPGDPPTREQIEAALRRTGGRMITAATLLGVKRRNLYRLCDKLGVDPDEFRPGE